MRWLGCLLSAVLLLPHSALAAVAFGTVGTAGSGTTSASIPYPASIAAGDLLIVCLANKYPTNGPSTPAGWTLPTNGQVSGGDGGGPGVDVGDVYATIFVKEADGSETGNLSITVTSGNSSSGVMARYTKGSGAWSYAATNGVDSSGDTSWSITGGADPGVESGDMLVTCTAINTESSAESAHSMSQTGITFGAANERFDNGTTFGDDVGVTTSDHVVSSGTSSAAPVYTATTTLTPEGATVLLRIREVSSAAVTPKGMLLGVSP